MVQVVYDEPAILDDYEGVDIETLTRELSPKNPFALNLMRITVDGEPIDDPGRSSADIQRCTDVALDHADILFQFDNLQSSPRLSVSAWPTTVAMAELTAWTLEDARKGKRRQVTRVTRATQDEEPRCRRPQDNSAARAVVSETRRGRRAGENSWKSFR